MNRWKMKKWMFLLPTVFMLAACGRAEAPTSETALGSEAAPLAETPAQGGEESAVAEEGVEYPLTVSHAYGETLLERKPERIVTISWGNQDVALALGVAPVGVSKANFGVVNEDGLLPWTAEAFALLGVEKPNVFDDTDGVNYEAISDARPDVILAAYSGMTQEEYDLLSQIAPVVAYPDKPWQTYWRDQIRVNAAGMGMKAEGDALVGELEKLIRERIAAYPSLKGKTAAFMSMDASDLSSFYVYLPTDPRAAYLVDLGFSFPESVAGLAENADSFYALLSAENADLLDDIDLIVTYGDEKLLEAVQKDGLLSRIPAIAKGAVVLMDTNSSLVASGTPSALSIPATIDEYLEMLDQAAQKAE